MATCHLSCTDSGSCFYNPSAPSNIPPLSNITSNNNNFLAVRYCCSNGISSSRYCCSDVSLAVLASPSDHPPESCLTGSWTSWRMISMAFGFVTILILVFVICHSARRCRHLRLMRPRRARPEDAAGSVESNPATAYEENTGSSIWNSWALVRGPVSAVSSPSTAPSFTHASSSSVGGQFVAPPSYASLQPLPNNYDKSLPPTYQEVIEHAESTPAQLQAVSHPPASSSSSSAAAAAQLESSSTSSTLFSSTAVVAGQDNKPNTTATTLTSDRPEIGVIRATLEVAADGGGGGVVNRAADLDDEDPPAYIPYCDTYATAADDRSGGGVQVTSSLERVAMPSSTVRSRIVISGDIVLSASVNATNQP